MKKIAVLSQLSAIAATFAISAMPPFSACAADTAACAAERMALTTDDVPEEMPAARPDITLMPAERRVEALREPDTALFTLPATEEPALEKL